MAKTLTDETRARRKVATFTTFLYASAAFLVFVVPAGLIAVLLRVASSTESALLHEGTVIASIVLGVFILLMAWAYPRAVRAMEPDIERLKRVTLAAERAAAEAKRGGR